MAYEYNFIEVIISSYVTLLPIFYLSIKHFHIHGMHFQQIHSIKWNAPFSIFYNVGLGNAVWKNAPLHEKRAKTPRNLAVFIGKGNGVERG